MRSAIARRLGNQLVILHMCNKLQILQTEWKVRKRFGNPGNRLGMLEDCLGGDRSKEPLPCVAPTIIFDGPMQILRENVVLYSYKYNRGLAFEM